MSKSRNSVSAPVTAAQLSGLFHRLAENPKLNTKVAIREAIRAEGLPGRDTFVEEVLEKRSEQQRMRKNREERRNQAHTGKSCPARAVKRFTPPVLLPAGTPASRLAAYRRKQVKQVAFKLLRSGASGGTSFAVEVTSDYEEVGYEVDMGANWDTYSGRFKGWKANEDFHCVKLPPQWMTRILKRNLAELDGLMTLEARPVVSGNPDVELFKAVWARQGRGYAVVTERGFIARRGDTNHHAESAEKALSGLQRKLAHQGCPARRVRSSIEIDDAAFIKRYRKVDCTLSLADARETGSCESGIVNWCECVGIDPKRETIHLSEALEAFSRYPLPEVRLAVMHAVRRHRKAQRNVA